jgi:hypothetical protein
MFSQQRGPYSAGRFAARLQAAGVLRSATAAGATVPQVLVLAGGWRGFNRAYGDDDTLVEGIDW